MSIKVSPSVLAADFGNIERECNLIDKSDADWFHLDVMDGIFVPNISFGMPVVKAIRKMTSKPLDVHLMITEPERYIEKFIEIGSDIISFHIEATNKLEENINLIKKFMKNLYKLPLFLLLVFNRSWLPNLKTTWAKLGPTWLNLGHLGPTSSQLGPTSGLFVPN